MPTYESNSHRVEIVDYSSFPSWRSSMVAWRWEAISGTDQSGRTVTPTQTGPLAYRVEAWNGFTVNPSTGVVYMAGNGGHADYSGNEVIAIDLSVDSPAWTVLSQPSAIADLVIDSAYYADGKPTSTHSYYATHFMASRNRVFRMGSGSPWGTGFPAKNKTDGFNIVTNTWDAESTWGSVGLSDGYDLAWSQAQHQTTGDIYTVGSTKLSRFTASTGTWTNLANLPDNGTGLYYRPAAVDHTRGEIMFFGNAYDTPAGGLLYDIAGNTFSEITFTGAQASAVAAAGGYAAEYDVANDEYLVKTSTAGTVIAVDPDTYAATTKTTTVSGTMPNVPNGVWSRFKYLPNLGGYVYIAQGTGNMWFLPTE